MTSKSKGWSTGIHTVFLSSLDGCLLRAFTLAESEIISTCKVQSIECFTKLILSIAFRSWSTKCSSTVEKEICALESSNPITKGFDSSKHVLASRMMVIIVVTWSQFLEINFPWFQSCWDISSWLVLSHFCSLCLFTFFPYFFA